MADPALVVTVSELCTLLKISKATGYKIVKAEGFPTLKVGNKILIPRAQLSTWIARRTGEGD